MSLVRLSFPRLSLAAFFQPGFLSCLTLIISLLLSSQSYSLYVQNVEERHVDGKNLICARFSDGLDSSVPLSDFFSIFKVEEDKPFAVMLFDTKSWELQPAQEGSNEQKEICYASTEPNTSYEVSILRGLPSVQGETLSQNFDVEITTRHLEPSVSFGDGGSILIPELSEGIPVVAVNVDEVRLDFYRLDQEFIDDNIVSIMRGSTYRIPRTLTLQSDPVFFGQYSLDIAKNTRATRLIPIGDIDAIKEKGIYLVALSRPGQLQQIEYRYFSVSDLGVHARFYDQEIQFHVSSLTNASAIYDAQIQIYDNEDSLLKRTSTDQQGKAVYRLSEEKSASYILVSKGDQQTFFSMQQPSLDLSEFDVGGRPYQQQELFLYSSRDLYRPGESVTVSGLLRDADGNSQPPVPLNAQLVAPGNQRQENLRVAAEDLGYYQFDFTIPSNARTGDWQLRVDKPDGKQQSYTFKVEEFLPERMELLLDTEQAVQVLRPDEPFYLPVQGNYLYGAPAVGNQYTAWVQSQHWRKPFDNELAAEKAKALYDISEQSLIDYKRFYFGNETDTTGVENYALDNGRLDGSGSTMLSVTNRWGQSRSPMRISTTISLQESGGRPVTRTQNQLVWPNASMIGIAPLFSKDEQGNDQIQPNSEAEFDLIRLDSELQNIGGSNIEVRLIRESERYFWQYSSNRGWHYKWASSEYMEQSQTIDISDGDKTKLSFPVEWGKYRLEALDSDSGAKTTLAFTAGYRWYWRWRHAQDEQNTVRPDRVVLAWDKEHYSGGDEAVLNIVSPFVGEHLVLLESDELLWSERIEMGSADTDGSVDTGGSETSRQIRIPVSENWDRHDIYVSVISLRPADKADLITPNRALGVIHLPLDRTERQIEVTFGEPHTNQHSPDQRALDQALKEIRKAQPNSRYPVELSVKNSDGTIPANAFVTLAAVDIGVLNITDFDTPDAHEWLFQPRRFGIDSRDVYADVIELSDAQTARLRFGGDALSKSDKQADPDVKIHQLFSGPVRVNSDGSLQVDLDLPDFNGRMRLMALAFSEDSYGMAEEDLQIAAPLVAEIAMPKFVTQGDRTEFALDLTNMTDDPLRLNANLSSSNLLAIEPLNAGQEPILLNSGERITLKYAVNAGMQVGVAQLELDLTGEGMAPIARHWALTVRAAYPEETRRQSILLGESNNQVSLDKNLLSGLIPETVEMSLVLSNDLNLHISDQTEGLFAYPYGCLEQTSSRLYPWVWLNAQNQSLLGVDEDTLKQQDQRIREGLQRLATMQKNHGGFGYWSSTSDESQWVTVFVAELLFDLHKQGLISDLTMLESANKRLQNYLSRPVQGNRYTQNVGHYQAAYRAYAAYVLAKQGKTTLGKVRTFAQGGLDQASSPLPYVHLGLAHYLLGDQKTAGEFFDQAMTIQRDEGYLGDYGSAQRDQAAILALYAEHNIRDFERAAIGLNLSENLRQRRYYSTQERAYLLRAAIAMDSYQTENRVPLNFRSRTDSGLNRTSRYTVSGETSLPVSVEGLQSGINLSLVDDSWLQGQLVVKGYPETHPQENSESVSQAPFGIQRTYYNEQGEKIELTELAQGDLVVTHIRVDSDERYQDALVVDLLPAGIELENQNLKHAVKLDKIYVDEQPLSYWSSNNDILFQEYRDDRYIAAVDLGYRWRSTNLYYLARAVVPGEYIVPPTLVEDMYRPELRSLGEPQPNLVISELKILEEQNPDTESADIESTDIEDPEEGGT